MTAFRVLACGTRNDSRTRDVEAALEALRAACVASARTLTVVHGDARGVDRAAGRWAERNSIEVVAVPANWLHCGPECPRPSTHPRHRVQRDDLTSYCPWAGGRRNQSMLTDHGPIDLVLAFPGLHSPGTWDMVGRARAAGVKVTVHMPEGSAPAPTLFEGSER